MAIIEQINQGIKDAMRSREQVRLDTLRMLKSKILAVDARAAISDEEVVKLFKTYFGNLQEALEQAAAVGRTDIADRLKSELAIIQEFLPKLPSREETKALVIQAIADSGAKTKKDLGLVMKALKKQGTAIDGKIASELIQELLGE